MPSKFAYLVISPSPIKGDYVYSEGGVSVDNKGSEEVAFKHTQIHHIKIGLQDELGDRVSAYNTHNPSIWFRHLEFQKPLDLDTKIMNLKKTHMEQEYKETSSSALYIQRMLLEGPFHKAFRAKEWFVLCDKAHPLQILCKELDSAVELESKKIKKRNKTIYGDVDVFDSEDDCIAFLQSRRKASSNRKGVRHDQRQVYIDFFSKYKGEVGALTAAQAPPRPSTPP